MDLVLAAKQQNRFAFNELVNKYKHIFYKTTRIFFTNDEEIYPLIEKSLLKSFKQISNVKNEQEFLCNTLKILILKCTKQKENMSENYTRSYQNRKIVLRITDIISLTEAQMNNSEYQKYRKSSIVEEYITSIEPIARVPALLYFYANLSISEISKILKTSKSEISNIIDNSRIKINEIIKNKEVDL